MTINIETLELLFHDFKKFVESKDKQPFTSFKSSMFVDTEENYKYSVYNAAREKLGNKWWKEEELGTGNILHAVSKAIEARVKHNNRIVNNNLINWRKRADFTKFDIDKNLELTIFNFYKNKVSDQQAFEVFVEKKFGYQFIAYLFFIKTYEKYMPISQEKFDEIFNQIGITGFKTSHNLSWDNYKTFNEIIKNVQKFLKTKDGSTTLLDAHSFLWILGNQMKKDGNIRTNEISSSRNLQAGLTQVQQYEPVDSNATNLTALQWMEILQNNKLTNELNLSTFKALYAFPGHYAYAGQVAEILELTHRPLNLEIGRYAKRIAEYYKINFTIRESQKFKYWDLFFNGWYDGTKFVWQLKTELVEALEQCGYSGNANPLISPLQQVYNNENLMSELEMLNIKMQDVLPEKRLTEIEATLRNDNLIVTFLKKVAEYKCQFPDCKAEVKMKSGINYVEVAHIRPVSEGGQSILGNLIVLCPNHHKEFDFGNLEIGEQKIEKSGTTLKGILNGKSFTIEIVYTCSNRLLTNDI